MSSFLRNLFNEFDILSLKPELKIKGETRFRTNVGITIGFLSITSIAIMSIYFTIDVFSRKKFSIIYNLDSQIYPQIDLKKNEIALILLDSMGKELENTQKLFSFMVKLWEIDIPLKFDSNSTANYSSYSSKATIIDIPLKNCSLLDNFKFKDFFNFFSTVYKSGLCLDFSKFNRTVNLYGNYGGLDGYSTLNIYLNRCVNSSALNKTDCYPNDIIDKKLSQNFLSLITIENDVNSNNFENPIQPFLKNEILPVSSTIFKNYFKDINLIEVNTDSNYILESNEKIVSYRTDKIVESVDLRGANTLFSGTYSQITFRCSGKTEIFSRIYRKFPETFAYIGGILQAITFVGRMLVYLWSKNSMMNYLIFNIFDLDEIKYFFPKNIDYFQKNAQNFLSASLKNNHIEKENVSLNNVIKIKKINLKSNKSFNNLDNQNLTNIKESYYNKINFNKNYFTESNKELKNQIQTEGFENSNQNFFQSKINQNILPQEKENNLNDQSQKFKRYNFLDNFNWRKKKSEENGEKISLSPHNLKCQREKGEEELNLCRLLYKKKLKNQNVLNFFDLICFHLVMNRNKRNFIKIATEIINKKISLEYSIKYLSNFEKLKMLLLTKEQQESFLKIPNLRLKDHLEEIINSDKISNLCSH